MDRIRANGSAEARQTLAELAKEPANPSLAQEAKAALQRLARRPKP